jgi:phasin family protein
MTGMKSMAYLETAAAVESTADIANKGSDKSLVTMKQGIERAAKGLEASQVKIKENMEKAMKTAEDMIVFGQGNMEAWVKASQIYASGFPDISKQFAASSKASMDEAVAFTKSLMGVKSVKEALDLQTGFAKSSTERAVSETNKLADASVKLAEQTIAPITARFTLAVETFSKTR